MEAMFNDLAAGTLSDDAFMDRYEEAKAAREGAREWCKACGLKPSPQEDEEVADQNVQILRAAIHRHPENDRLHDLYVSLAARCREKLHNKKQRQEELVRQRKQLAIDIGHEEYGIAVKKKRIEYLREKLAEIEAELSKS
jgi:hypothetical protein